VDLVLRWLHVLAAVTWLGGMLFIALVLVPVTRGIPDPALRTDLVVRAGRRFRAVGWIALLLLVATGLLMVVRRPGFLWIVAFQVKALLVLLVLALSVLHDFVLGPRAGRAPGDPALRRRVSRLARLNLLVVLVIVYLALSLRG
jgi:putative copper resistance protein D